MAFSPLETSVALLCVATPWQMGGHILTQNSSAGPGSLAIMKTMANGTTIFVAGIPSAAFSVNLLTDQTGGHPDPNLGIIEEQSIGEQEYMNKILYPPSSGSGGYYSS